MRKLSEFCTIRNYSFRDCEDDGSVLSIESRTEEFTPEGSYLLRREIHDADYLLAHEFVSSVVDGDLGA